jgi:hypothetical protein
MLYFRIGIQKNLDRIKEILLIWNAKNRDFKIYRLAKSMKVSLLFMRCNELHSNML